MPRRLITAPRSSVLLAVISEAKERFARILAGHVVTVAEHSDEARSLLEQEVYALVVLGVHFDESQMFSLLGDIRAHARYRKVPILCVLESRGRYLNDIATEGLDHAVKALMANGFLNLERFADDDEGNARVARIADYLILIDGDLQQNPQGTNDVLWGGHRALLGQPRRRESDPH